MHAVSSQLECRCLGIQEADRDDQSKRNSAVRQDLAQGCMLRWTLLHLPKGRLKEIRTATGSDTCVQIYTSMENSRIDQFSIKD